MKECTLSQNVALKNISFPVCHYIVNNKTDRLLLTRKQLLTPDQEKDSPTRNFRFADIGCDYSVTPKIIKFSI